MNEIIFYAAVEQERGKVAVMPKTREQRAQEREQFNRKFGMWVGVIYSLAIIGVIALLSATRGQ